MAERRYFHGGPRGFNIGGMILPPSKTGVTPLASKAAGHQNREKVYVTTEFAASLMYAAGHKDGCVYQVVPIGKLLEDPDCDRPGLSYECDAAKIVKRWKLSGKQLKLIRKTLVADHHAQPYPKNDPFCQPENW